MRILFCYHTFWPRSEPETSEPKATKNVNVINPVIRNISNNFTLKKYDFVQMYKILNSDSNPFQFVRTDVFIAEAQNKQHWKSYYSENALFRNSGNGKLFSSGDV